MKTNDGYKLLAARVLLSAIFIMGGIGKITGWEGSVGYTGSVLPYPELFTAIAIVLELGGGLMLLFGYKIKWAIKGLIVFTLAASVLYHNDFADQTQMIMFMKNIAIVGGLLALCVVGAGSVSCDGKCEKKEETTEDPVID